MHVILLVDGGNLRQHPNKDKAYHVLIKALLIIYHLCIFYVFYISCFYYYIIE